MEWASTSSQRLHRTYINGGLDLVTTLMRRARKDERPSYVSAPVALPAEAQGYTWGCSQPHICACRCSFCQLSRRSASYIHEVSRYLQYGYVLEPQRPAPNPTQPPPRVEPRQRCILYCACADGCVSVSLSISPLRLPHTSHACSSSSSKTTTTTTTTTTTIRQNVYVCCLKM